MRICIEMDDFSPRNSGLGLLEDLKDHYKGFKVTLFTVPWEIRWGEPTPITDAKFRPFCNAIKKAENWMEIAIHGLTHFPMEFAHIGYDEAKKRIMIAEKMLINRGIKYAKIFKAPHWKLSPGGKKAALELGFKIVEDGYYNWNLKDERPTKEKILIAHGHIQNDACGNGIEMVMPKLLQLPAKTKFIWLSEYLVAEKVNSPKILEDLRRLEHEGLDD